MQFSSPPRKRAGVPLLSNTSLSLILLRKLMARGPIPQPQHNFSRVISFSWLVRERRTPSNFVSIACASFLKRRIKFVECKIRSERSAIRAPNSIRSNDKRNVVQFDRPIIFVNAYYTHLGYLLYRIVLEKERERER